MTQYLVLNYSYKPLGGDEITSMREKCGFGDDAQFVDIGQYANMPVPDPVLTLINAESRKLPDGSVVEGGMPFILLLNGDAFEALKGLAHARAHGLWSDAEWPVVVVRHFGKEMLELNLEQYIWSQIPPMPPQIEDALDAYVTGIKEDVRL